jgi:hypothetical protein
VFPEQGYKSAAAKFQKAFIVLELDINCNIATVRASNCM